MSADIGVIRRLLLLQIGKKWTRLYSNQSSSTQPSLNVIEGAVYFARGAAALMIAMHIPGRKDPGSVHVVSKK